MPKIDLSYISTICVATGFFYEEARVTLISNYGKYEPTMMLEKTNIPN